MSWGVATQNGVSVSLASIVSLSAGVTEFSPADLFTGGTVGAWYDPSDYSTLFQDSAGTTPVTAVEQPVGLMLDKSQGLVIGPELITNGGPFTTTTGWTAGNNAVLSATGGRLRVTNNVTDYGQAGISFTTVANTWYAVTFSGFVGTSGFFRLTVGSSIGSPGILGENFSSDTGTITRYFLATGTTTWVTAQCNTTNDTAYVELGSMSVKSIAGNHASQATAASRPVLRARYNLLTYSEQFDNAAWSKLGLLAFGSGSVANATTAPDGTTTADLIVESGAGAGSVQHYVYQTPTLAATTYTLSVYLKAAGRNWAMINCFAGSAFFAFFNLSNGTLGTITAGTTATITSVGNGWYRCSISFAASAGGSDLGVRVASADNIYTYTGDGTSGIYVWGADLRTGSSAGTYQRIAAATDYATAGFLPYLAADGVDDSMVIPAAAISGATAMTEMHAAWRPAGFGSGNGVVFGGTGTGLTNDHEPFSDGNLYYGFASSSRQDFGSLGTVTTSYLLDATQTGTTLAAFRNGTQLSTTKTVSLAIGATTRLFVSNNSTLQYYQGNFFGGLMIKKVLSAAETSAARSWFAAKAGITL